MSPTHHNVDFLLMQMTESLRKLISEKNLQDPLFIGIRSGGIWIAEQLHNNLAISEPLGTLDISFYRDDFTRIGLDPKVQPSKLPSSTQDRHIILIDDVIKSGRTIRAALNELFDYGRPASVSLVALIDLGCRELPISADIIGSNLNLAPDQHIKLIGPEPLSLEISLR
ncbi:MAG: bifunctional pyr operon transcriptional regulator/uracil phosphoribosyltransferase PyrR [Oceanospirillaceae bacterium]|nr:bifunctional pyr operon transcriptional regulator/uracil phosphoribosyltransferase PyrR [Oceanospirillaceae bacterium]